jgi:hypothetical protein
VVPPGVLPTARLRLRRLGLPAGPARPARLGVPGLLARPALPHRLALLARLGVLRPGQRQLRRQRGLRGRHATVTRQRVTDRRGGDPELLRHLLLGPVPLLDQHPGPGDRLLGQRGRAARALDHPTRAGPPKRRAQPADRARAQPERGRHLPNPEPHLSQRHDRQVPRAQVTGLKRPEQHHRPVTDHQLPALPVGVHPQLRTPRRHPRKQSLHRPGHTPTLPEPKPIHPQDLHNSRRQFPQTSA